MKRIATLLVLVTFGCFAWACDWGEGCSCPEFTAGPGWCPVGVEGCGCSIYDLCPGFCLAEDGVTAVLCNDGGTGGGEADGG